MTDRLQHLRAALADRYAVERELGSGGMATVYLAEDLKHHRQVAIKVLRPELAAVLGSERFLREIEITAQLAHPHILPLLDSGAAAGFLYYVMPYVEGESLRDRLVREKQLPVEDALKLAGEVADALGSAHRRNVVHRDIKPENILLEEGHAVVADFGIARAVSVAGKTQLTETGISLGTPAYLSPEQAAGERELDGRSDIYALGCVLYEMLAGQPPFSGPTAESIAHQHLSAEAPSVTTIRPAVPEGVVCALRKSLAKTPADRFSDADEFARSLSQGSGAISAVYVAPEKSKTKASRMWQAAAVVSAVVAAVAVTAVFLVRSRSESPSTAQPSRFAVPLPPEQTLQAVLPSDQSLQNVGFFGSAVAISPDGSKVVYVARHEGTPQLYLRPIGELEARPIPGTEGARTPFFSSDGQWVGFYANRELRKVPVEGGMSLSLASIDIAVFGGSWANSDTILIGHCSNGLEVVPASGGSRQSISRVDISDPEHVGRQHQFPQRLPGDEWVMFTVFNSADDTRIELLSLVTGEQRTLVSPGTYARYLPTGHVVYAVDGDLMAAPLDLETVSFAKTPVRVLEGVLMEADRGTAHFDVSENGTLVYISGGLTSVVNNTLTLVDRDGEETDLGLPPGQSLRFSPVGNRILLSRPLSVGGIPDLWVYDLDGGTQIRLTDERAEEWWAVWTPDGEHVVFESNKPGGPFNLYSMPWDGSGSIERLTENDKFQFPYSVSPDGKVLAYVESEELGNRQYDIWTMPLEGDRTPRPFLQTPANEIHPAFSPDGRWMAYTSNESGDYEVYVRPFPGPGASRQISTDNGHQPLWSPDGRALYYRKEQQVLKVPLETDPDLAAGRVEVLFGGRYSNVNALFGRLYDLSPDGERFLMLRVDDPPAPAMQYTVVLNWFEELKRMVPID